MVGKRFLLIFTGQLLLTASLFAQPKASVRNIFLSDSVKIGQPLKIALICSSPSTSELFFPDSSYDFSPFEFLSKRFFPTKTRNGVSRDSVVYELVNFEVKKAQPLALPVFFLKEDGDTITAFAAPDSVRVTEMLTDNQYLVASVRTETSFSEPKQLVNHPYRILIAVLSIFFPLLIFLLFRNKILKFYKKLRLRISTRRFIYEFENMCRSTETAFSAVKLQKTLVLWKKFLEDIESVPLSSMTGKEIASHYRNRKLRAALESVDKCIYGTRKSVSLLTSLKTLGKFAEERAKSKTRVRTNV